MAISMYKILCRCVEPDGHLPVSGIEVWLPVPVLHRKGRRRDCRNVVNRRRAFLSRSLGSCLDQTVLCCRVRFLNNVPLRCAKFRQAKKLSADFWGLF